MSLDNTQSNTRGIEALASTTGNLGYGATTFSIATGNAVTTCACSDRGGVITTLNNRTSSGGIGAGSTSRVTDSATAVRNSARILRASRVGVGHMHQGKWATAFCTFAILSAPSHALAQKVVGFWQDTLLQHRIEGARTIEFEDPKATLADNILIRVTITPDGRVSDARKSRDNDGGVDLAPALAAARGWRFKPFDYRGKPVTAVGLISFEYRRKPVWVRPGAAFPSIDYGKLKITLVRTACFGSCPDYTVTIHGDGRTAFSTRTPPAGQVAGLFRQYRTGDGVLAPGVHYGRIDRATLDALVARFQAAHFFGLKSQYAAAITDSPSYILRFASGDRAMQVRDYVGQLVGMPQAVTELESAVDRAAGTARWVTGNNETVPALLREGLDVHGRAAKALAITAMGTGDDAQQVVLDLVEAGLPLDDPLQPPDGPATTLGAYLLSDAVLLGRSRVADGLIALGWLKRTPKSELANAFAAGGGGCDARIARTLIGVGVEVNVHAPVTKDGDNFEGGETALISALKPYGSCRLGDKDVAPLVRALIGLGADVNAIDAKGQSALFYRDEIELLDLLLDSGAAVNVHDKRGVAPVFTTWVDRQALRLLDAGADPYGKDEDGKTLRQVAIEHDMPATFEWLDARRIP